MAIRDRVKRLRKRIPAAEEDVITVTWVGEDGKAYQGLRGNKVIGFRGLTAEELAEINRGCRRNTGAGMGNNAS